MENVCILFKKLDGVPPDNMREIKNRPGYENVDIHMIFGIKMDGNFTRKSILIADIPTISPPPQITH